MIEQLKFLHYNVGRQRQVQWSLLNDESMSTFSCMALVEPYLYADPTTGAAKCGAHHRWRSLTPTVQRDHSAIRYGYRAMLWVRAAVQVTQVPVPSHDIAAAVIKTQEGYVLIISAYDPGVDSEAGSRESHLHQKLALICDAIDEARRSWGSTPRFLVWCWTPDCG